MKTASKPLVPPLKWHGGKHYLAKRIVGLMPPHTHYVEPYFGGGSVLLAKDPEGVSEVVNDLDKQLINFWMVLEEPRLFRQFRRRIEAIPFSQHRFAQAKSHPLPVSGPDVELAVAFYIKVRQSRQALRNDFTTLSRNRTRRGMNEQASAWIGSVEGLQDVHARLQRVVILAQQALTVIRSQDGPNTLFYCDPPYLHETRTATAAYAYEMTEQDHRDLVGLLQMCKGKVMISGYPSRLYDRMAFSDWNRHDFPIDVKASSSATKRRVVECVWCNF